MPTGRTPAQALSDLLEGNGRFVRGEMEHPSQGIGDRAGLSVAQHPFAVVLGCSDSRVAAEIVFDRGLGDLFVVRTAGHVVDDTVLGSVEFGVQVLGAPLVVVLGHRGCGAVAAAVEALTTGRMPGGFVRAVVDRVIPSIAHLPDSPAPGQEAPDTASTGQAALPPSAEALGHAHVRHTVRRLQGYSAVLSERVREGRCAVVGMEYALSDGQVRLVETVGRVEA